MTKKNILVVGASRGIGKGLAEILAADADNHVTGTSSKAVDQPGTDSTTPITMITLDQTSTASCQKAAAAVPALDTLVLNAAMGAPDKLLDTSEDRLQTYLDTNVVGLLRVVRAFLPALRAGGMTRQIVVVSSQSGSMTRQINATRGFMGPYAVTKAAANMLAIQLHNELHASEGFTVVMVHPGWVATDLGKMAGDGGMPIAKSAGGIAKILQDLQYEDSAKFYNFDGTLLPW